MQFEKDTDPFGIDSMIADVTGGNAGQKPYGMQEADRGRDDGRSSKRARVDDED